MSRTISARVAELGLTLETASAPPPTTCPAGRQSALYLGQISRKNGQAAYLGQLGGAVSEADGVEAARLSALECCRRSPPPPATAWTAWRVVKLGVFVASAPDFSRQSIVANGASDLMVAVFGDAGRHSRSAVGVAALPQGVPSRSRPWSR